MSQRIALLFAGQGAQQVGMGGDLVEASPEVAQMYTRADQLLQMPLSQVSFEGPVETLTQTTYCQPALYLHGLALLKLFQLRKASFKFEATAGLSLGEFTAHAAAGTFSFEEGLRLVAVRGKLMQMACEMSKGGMVSLIGATEEQAQAIAQESGLEVANYNCPGQIVLSGAKEKIVSALKISEEKGIKKAIPLQVAGAYHSKLMQPAQDQFCSFLDQVHFQKTSIQVASNVTGQLISPEDNVANLLLEQITHSVCWGNCIQTLKQIGITHFIELGPGKVLAGLCKRIDKEIVCLSAGNLIELEAILDEIE